MATTLERPSKHDLSEAESEIMAMVRAGPLVDDMLESFRRLANDPSLRRVAFGVLANLMYGPCGHTRASPGAPRASEASASALTHTEEEGATAAATIFRYVAENMPMAYAEGKLSMRDRVHPFGARARGGQ